MHVRSSQLVRYLAILLLCACCQMTGCGSLTDKSSSDSDLIIQWPSPPEPPRIRFLYSFSTSSDLDIGGGFFSWLAGEDNIHQLRRPVAVTVNSRNTLYVADLSGAIFSFNPDTKESIRQDHAVGEALISPVSLAVGNGDSLYVIDSALRKLIVYDADLNPIYNFSQEFVRPSSVVFNQDMNSYYVADAGANKVYVIRPNGSIDELIGPNSAQPYKLNTPTHLCTKDNRLYVTDAYNFKIKIFDTDGVLQDSLGQLGKTTGSFARPKGVAVDNDDHTYVVDALFGNIQIFDDQGSLLLFFGESSKMNPGGFSLPNGIFIDDANKIYVADTYHGSVQVFQYLSVGG